jgi:hypothetical protein
MSDANSEPIRALNDRLCQQHTGGTITITPGIEALGEAAVVGLLHAVAHFDKFAASNDPWNEHDMGCLMFEGHRVFWKIDYYDRAMVYKEAERHTVTWEHVRGHSDDSNNDRCDELARSAARAVRAGA